MAEEVIRYLLYVIRLCGVEKKINLNYYLNLC